MWLIYDLFDGISTCIVISDETYSNTNTIIFVYIKKMHEGTDSGFLWPWQWRDVDCFIFIFFLYLEHIGIIFKYPFWEK